jgi:hypothetical protein
MERPRSSHAAPRQADHRNSFTFEIRLHRTSKVKNFLPQRSQRAQRKTKKKKLKNCVRLFRNL